MIKLEIISPGRGANGNDYAKEIKRALDQIANDIYRDLKQTTQTWNHKPVFQIRVLSDRVEAFTTDAVYGYLDQGTGKYGPKHRPYPIRPKKANGILRFQTGYVAKSRSGVINSYAGGASGDMVYAKEVLHPGIEPRKFIETIQKRRQKTIEQRLSDAIAKVARK